MGLAIDLAGVLAAFSFLTEALADLGSAAGFFTEALPDLAAFSDLAGVALAGVFFSSALAGRFFPETYSSLPLDFFSFGAFSGASAAFLIL